MKRLQLPDREIACGIIWLVLIVIPLIFSPELLDLKIKPESLRGLGLYLLGAGIAPLGLYLTHSRTKSLRIQTDTEKIKNVTDAFAKSVELLGNKSAAARQGGIYALDKIVQDNPEKYHITVIKIMASYIRKESKEDYDKFRSNVRSNFYIMSADIEAAIDVIRQRNFHQKQEVEDKEKLNLKRYTFFLDISNTHLTYADFSGTDLSKTNFSDSYLSGCIFYNTDLLDSSFRSSIINRALFTKSILKKCEFKNANLRECDFEECDFEGCELDGATFKNCNLSKAKNLTQEQISKAKIDEDTMLPPDIENSQDRSSSEQI